MCRRSVSRAPDSARPSAWPRPSAGAEALLRVRRARLQARDRIPAAVHVDGTGRIQTVERSSNPRYYGLIEEFGRLTGVPVLLNTSFNRTEPIVASPRDAIECYLRSGMDVLVLGDFYTTDRPPAAVGLATDRAQPAASREVLGEPALAPRTAPN